MPYVPKKILNTLNPVSNQWSGWTAPRKRGRPPKMVPIPASPFNHPALVKKRGRPRKFIPNSPIVADSPVSAEVQQLVQNLLGRKVTITDKNWKKFMKSSVPYEEGLAVMRMRERKKEEPEIVVVWIDDNKHVRVQLEFNDGFTTAVPLAFPVTLIPKIEVTFQINSGGKQ